ncbi:MAG TPA: 2'-5' RNA ligase family protein [Polyangiales bacterium]|nr:2'-5' RNA ligase family protein [Polyangiales bacterium]
MLVSFALAPPPELAQTFAVLRAQLDPEHAPKTIPYLTVKQPFETGDLEAVLERVRALRLREVSIVLRESGVFDTAQFGSVLHLHAPRTPELDALHTALLQALADVSQSGPRPEVEDRVFYPHLTLAQGLEAAVAREALGKLTLALPIAFEARELVMGVRDEQGVWNRPHTFALSASSRPASSAHPAQPA